MMIYATMLLFRCSSYCGQDKGDCQRMYPLRQYGFEKEKSLMTYPLQRSVDGRFLSKGIDGREDQMMLPA